MDVYILRNTITKSIIISTVAEILEEINRDRSEDWEDYNEKDFMVGLREFTEYKIIGKLREDTVSDKINYKALTIPGCKAQAILDKSIKTIFKELQESGLDISTIKQVHDDIIIEVREEHIPKVSAILNKNRREEEVRNYKKDIEAVKGKLVAEGVDFQNFKKCISILESCVCNRYCIEIYRDFIYTYNTNSTP